ncbi:MAG: aminopeptidase [Clostridiaceae bacterium]
MNEKYEACNVLLTTCSDCKKGENILIVTDPTSIDVARIMWDAMDKYTNKSIAMMDERTMHGQDPNRIVAAAMAEADVIFGCTKFSLFHSQARRDAVAGGARFVNMVDYNVDMMKKGGLYCDFESIGEICSKVAKRLEGGKVCHITTASGSDFTCSIADRAPNPQYARSLVAGASSSPPDVECATCAVEGTGEGIVYIDGSIPHPELGLITDEIKLTIKNGLIVAIEGGEQAKKLERIMKEFNDPNVYNVGEIGLGLNPMCELNGRMLEDEGCGGTVHFGCGDNRGFGGIVASAYHLDMVFKNPTLTVDGKIILDEGRVV